MVFKKQREEELKKLNEKKNKEGENKDDEKKDDNKEENEKTYKKKERKKIVFLEKTEEIPNVEFPGEKEFNKEEENK
jgi:translation elongation factor EF-1alpha